MPTLSSADAWESGEAYEQYVGRWSRMVAREFLAWLEISPGAVWLDVGCGTGALTEVILSGTSPAHVLAIDPSLAYVRFGRSNVRDRRADFVVADARSLPEPARSVDVVVSGLAMNFIPQPDIAVAEMARVARAGGVAALYVWDYADRMQLMRYFWDAAAALDPRALELDEARRFPICNRVALEALLRGAGFRGVESLPVDVPTLFPDFDDYWRPFLGGQGPAPGYVVSLGNRRRSVLRERIRAALPVAADGSIDLAARAWAVRGTVW